MRKKISLMLPLLCAPLAFWACGDGESNSGTSANGSVSEADLVVATFDDLPVCSGKREGATAYVKDEKTAYICEDGKWISDDETDGDDSSSSVKPGSSSSSVNPGSSSSKKDDPMSSSSVVSSSSEKSSSSVNSSSSIESSSSSSVTLNEVEGSSSSSVIPGSDPESSSSRGLFDMTKDEFLNPEITYGTMTDKRDNKTYKTVKIGDQVWMAENLNYADSTKMPSLKGKSWCYDDKAENCDVTGRLYTWAAAIDSVALANDADNPQTCGYGETCTLPTVVQGVCPSGWHLPTYDEWQTLFKAVGGSSAAGKALKSGSGWSGNGNGTDTYGFSALPAGGRNDNGYFRDAGNHASFWSASEDASSYAYFMRLYYYYEYAYMDYHSKNLGYSVRCLQN
ncbi:fibrobacter succinogenes major paralogous domain-containing protein [Fibrobacter sp. UWEL]|uniref:fibrobacter succinogenes major paralogous domain-containing protein n=1 Tax=Fibrobacter sp. UWEL TaxID=1896209 RepID=UPI000914D968|nr:fibrobacter succinogenes major paralogous domain-containing protein [Fibrobacter sp. UWEL]SHL56621.1 major paralogous domain-containing protein [Fibrobacter sp. UWEL]